MVEEWIVKMKLAGHPSIARFWKIVVFVLVRLYLFPSLTWFNAQDLLKAPSSLTYSPKLSTGLGPKREGISALRVQMTATPACTWDPSFSLSLSLSHLFCYPAFLFFGEVWKTSKPIENTPEHAIGNQTDVQGKHFLWSNVHAKWPCQFQTSHTQPFLSCYIRIAIE